MRFDARSKPASAPGASPIIQNLGISANIAGSSRPSALFSNLAGPFIDGSEPAIQKFLIDDGAQKV
jgi:hypothetical protein